MFQKIRISVGKAIAVIALLAAYGGMRLAGEGVALEFMAVLQEGLTARS